MPAFEVKHVSNRGVWGGRAVGALSFIMNSLPYLYVMIADSTLEPLAVLIGFAIGAYVIYFVVMKFADEYLGWRKKRRGDAAPATN